jgi:hypothetical protein
MLNPSYVIEKAAPPRPLSLREKAMASLALTLWIAVVLAIAIEVVGHAPAGDPADRQASATTLLQASAVNQP